MSARSCIALPVSEEMSQLELRKHIVQEHREREAALLSELEADKRSHASLVKEQLRRCSGRLAASSIEKSHVEVEKSAPAPKPTKQKVSRQAPDKTKVRAGARERVCVLR